RRPQVRHRGVDPHPGQVPRADLDLQLHRVPGPSAGHPDARRARQPAAGHAQRHALRGAAHHRRHPGEPPAGRRLGRAAHRAAAVPRRARGAGAGRQVSAAARPYDLVATDLDGTLLRTDVTVSPRTRAALATATAAGAAHLVVTGRGVAWTRPILDAIGYTGLAVCGQGAQLY